MKISVIGTGYVGLTVGTGLADFGWNVVCVDRDKERIENLQQGIVPIYEVGLKELVDKNVREGRLSFTTDVKTAIELSDVIFITVGTPSNDDGSVDLSQIWDVAKEIGNFINGYKVVVVKSTVPIGTTRKVYNVIINESNGKYLFDIVFNPEFLREGTSVQDFFHPDRVVIGAESDKARKIMEDVYRPLYIIQTPFIFTNIETAEMIKYAANSFLAMKITFINEVANLCEKVGADVHDVAKALGMDGRIGPKFLHPGPGYGGSCFPKDTKAFAYIAKQYGSSLPLIESVIRENENQRLRMVEKIKKLANMDLKNKTIAMLGLAFKQNTDDVRDSPAITIINELLKEGAIIKAYDPQAMGNARRVFGDKILYCKDEYEAANDSDILVIVTDWNQFRGLDLQRIKQIMKSPILADLRNVLDPMAVKENGFIYEGVGRK
jgi:UDPglucose 6-dehydrogenase